MSGDIAFSLAVAEKVTCSISKSGAELRELSVFAVDTLGVEPAASFACSVVNRVRICVVDLVPARVFQNCEADV
jgi:hypothetical protein